MGPTGSSSSGDTPLPDPGSLGAWLLAVRLPTLAAALVPVAVGTGIAHVLGSLRPGPALAALLGAMLIQVGSNFANDAYDFEKGADQADRQGPVRAAAAQLLTPGQLKRGVMLVFLAATCVGGYLAYASSPWILCVGGVSMVAAVLYTGGPFPLAYHGLGDLFVFVFFGLVAVPGTVYVQTGVLSPLALCGGAAVGALATNILVVNNLRDIPSDRRANKRTLAVRLGRRFALTQYLAMLVVAYAALLVLAYSVGCLTRISGVAWPVVAPLMLLPVAASLWFRLRSKSGRALNPVLKGTAGLLLGFGALLTGGLLCT